jgi:hypothetical protein
MIIAYYKKYVRVKRSNGEFLGKKASVAPARGPIPGPLAIGAEMGYIMIIKEVSAKKYGKRQRRYYVRGTSQSCVE